MACNCSETGLGNTQSNLVAYVIPGGCGPRNPQLYAMSDSRDWPGIRVTNVTENLRGARTPIQRRSGRNPRKSIRCGVQEAAPAANTITVEVESCGCGGLDPSELIECEFDIMEYEVCCDAAGNPVADFSKIKHWRGISIENNQYSNRVSFDTNDNNPLTITHAGEFASGHTYYTIAFNEIALSAGEPTGTNVTDLVYSENENCGSSGCGRRIGCGDQWYAITDDGNVIYKSGPGEELANVAIPGFVASDAVQYTRIGLHRNRLYVSTSPSIADPVNIYSTPINQSSGEPGTWTAVTTADSVGFRPYGFVSVGNDFWLFGHDSPNFEGRVFEVAVNGALTSIFQNQNVNTALLNVDTCEGSVLFAGLDGTVMVNSGCSDELTTLTAPAATSLRAAGIRTGNELWVGGDDGNLYWTETNGEIWNTVALPQVGVVIDIKWATPCVGYVATVVGGVAVIYTTWNGGETWTDSADRIETPPTTLDNNTRIRIPCCTNGTAQVNNVSVVGGDGANGMIYQTTIQNC